MGVHTIGQRDAADSCEDSIDGGAGYVLARGYFLRNALRARTRGRESDIVSEYKLILTNSIGQTNIYFSLMFL